MIIEINKHSSICINNEIYVDPLDLTKFNNAKYIFITHQHWDHFSVEDINKILTKETVLICPKTMQAEINQFNNKTILVEPNKSYKIDDLEFSTFNSYNIDKKFHPKANNWVGYNLKIEEKSVVIVGDSDETPELKAQKADILLVPIGGEFTMNYEEAAHLTNLIHPQKVIPTHYGEIVGNLQMADKFAKLIDDDIECEILLK